MTRKQKAALRKSVRRAVAQVVWDALACRINYPFATPNVWCQGAREWCGPEIGEVCRQVYGDVCKALKRRDYLSRPVRLPRCRETCIR